MAGAGPGIPQELLGLTAGEADRRLTQVGPNRWVPRARFAGVRAFARTLLDPMAAMLVAAAIVYFVVGETRDAIVLAFALIPVLGVDVALEARAHAALEKLARAAAPLADVVRDGRVQSVPFEEVVPGDVLALHEGGVIAADCVVRAVANLAVDESSLTGESEPQGKQAWAGDAQNAPADAVAFAGSVVRSGHGFATVATTGASTRYGGIAALVAQTAPEPSPLQRRAARLVRGLGAAALVVAAALIVIGRIRGESWTDAILGAVSLAMAAIPEEFPLVLTLFLSVGAWRLAERGMLVRRLASVETLGSTTVICTDKTGTLTLGLFQVARHVVLDPSLSVPAFLELAVLACERHPSDAMEHAIASYAEQHDVSPAQLASRWTLIRDYDFDPVGKHMSHVWCAADGTRCVVAAKGALEGVLAHCRNDNGARERAIEANQAMAAAGMRVLLVAARRTTQPGANRDEDERDLTICGLLGFHDPLRPEVPDAVRECQHAGVRIKMITGDHALTAHAMAESAGILHDDALIVTGEELAALGEQERAAKIDRAAIFARISPEQKFVIVDGLKRAGAIVAMTGDGVNDAPALRRADIGIAMGQRGTDVARATADLVLLDDNFASIVATIKQGRHILQNVQRAFLYLIAFHVPIIALAVAVPVAGLPLLLLPIHLVWLELIVHPVSALVFQAEPVTADVMERPPRDPAAPLLPRAAVIRSTVSGLVLAAATFGMYWMEAGAVGELQARALALIVLAAGYQALMFVERLALQGPATAVIPRTRMFWGVWWVVAASAVAVIYLPAVANLFRVAAPDTQHVAWAVVFGVASVAWRFAAVR